VELVEGQTPAQRFAGLSLGAFQEGKPKLALPLQTTLGPVV